MISVAEAEQIIFQEVRDYGVEAVPLELALDRVLAEDILAERDIPACNKATMDGIAILYSAFDKGLRSFNVKGIIAAGNTPIVTEADNECVEIMTGAPVPDTQDTVVRYEDVEMNSDSATIKIDEIKKGQNIHRRGRDKQEGDIVARGNQRVDATIISVAASAGKSKLMVRKLPKVVVMTTGDELVSIDTLPTPYQLRGSNNHMIRAVLQQYAVTCDMLHIPDDPDATKDRIQQCLDEYDVIILTGGVSMGKYDYVPQVLDELKVVKQFHKIMQKPGKPFWFGKHTSGALVFAFPGNPVSTFLCLHRYFMPWLELSLYRREKKRSYAVLNSEVTFSAALQYFMQVSVAVNEDGQLIANPAEGNGSGDFSNLADSNAFMELPAEKNIFKKGEAYRIWPFKQIV
ncbi:MAG: molybdopterin biosynthesis protein MoeA [Flavipsychrobacter sp.]|nr:molybdopterin biosynthesis protein MoeA [Flavipsychrobacter sp.]